MLLRWFDFFKKNDSQDYYKLGGPRSFYKYKYHHMNIILMGEVHKKMPAALAGQYQSLVSRFADQGNGVKLLIEYADVTREKNSGDTGFIGSMLNLENTSKLSIVKSDKRSSPAGLDEFDLFLKCLGEIQKEAYDYCKKLNVKYQPPYPYFKDVEFQNILHKLANDINATFTLDQLYQFLDSQVIAMDLLAQRYSSEHAMLDGFLGACVLGVNDGLGKLIELDKKYKAMRDNNDSYFDKSLADICIEMIAHEGDCSAAQSFFDILLSYYGSYLDGTLACDIWDEMNDNKENETTLLIVTGDAHTERLALLMSEICEVVVEIPADKSGKIISVRKMDELLHDDFRHVPSNSKCSIM